MSPVSTKPPMKQRVAPWKAGGGGARVHGAEGGGGRGEKEEGSGGEKKKGKARAARPPHV